MISARDAAARTKQVLLDKTAQEAAAKIRADEVRDANVKLELSNIPVLLADLEDQVKVAVSKGETIVTQWLNKELLIEVIQALCLLLRELGYSMKIDRNPRPGYSSYVSVINLSWSHL